MVARTNPIRDVKRSEAADKWVLGLAFLLGAAGIYAIKIKYSEIHPFSVAVWSVIILLLYVGSAWWVGKSRIEAETIGDNCYYLGFVFTLASLAITLYLLVQTKGQTAEIRDVISGFGVALSSTIFGIILRVLHIRMSPDIASLDRQTRIELHAAVRSFRTNLSASLRELKHFSVETAQMLSEQRDAIYGMSKETIETHKQFVKTSMEEQAKILNETLADATGEAAETITDAVAKTTNVAYEELLNSISGMRKAVADLAREESETLKKLVEDSAGISGESVKVQAALEDFAGEIVHFLSEQRGEIRKASKETIELHGQVLQAGMKEQTRMINETLAAATGKATEAIADEVVKATKVAYEELLTSIAGMREAIADLALKETESLRTLVEDSSSITSEGTKVQTALKHYSAETVRILYQLRDEIRVVSRETMETHRQVLKADIEEQTKVINVAHEELLTSIAGMREVVADLARKESETLKSLVEDSSGISSESAKVQIAVEALAKRLDTVLLNLDAATKHVPRENGPTVNPPAGTSEESNAGGGGRSWWRRQSR